MFMPYFQNMVEWNKCCWKSHIQMLLFKISIHYHALPTLTSRRENKLWKLSTTSMARWYCLELTHWELSHIKEPTDFWEVWLVLTVKNLSVILISECFSSKVFTNQSPETNWGRYAASLEKSRHLRWKPKYNPWRLNQEVLLSFSSPRKLRLLKPWKSYHMKGHLVKWSM